MDGEPTAKDTDSSKSEPSCLLSDFDMSPSSFSHYLSDLALYSSRPLSLLCITVASDALTFPFTVGDDTEAAFESLTDPAASSSSGWL